MGIKDINKFFKTKTPRAFRRVNADHFRDKRIAIDTQPLGHRILSAVYGSYIMRELSDDQLLDEDPFESSSGARETVRQRVFTRFVHFVADFYERGITPIFVFDGACVPEKVSGARTTRAKGREGTQGRICALREQLREVEPPFRSKKDLLTLRGLLKQDPPINRSLDFPYIESFIRETLGCPVLHAPDEGEKFCAFLAAKGIAAASWSTDTDSFAFGAPMFITGFSDEIADVKTEGLRTEPDEVERKSGELEREPEEREPDSDSETETALAVAKTFSQPAAKPRITKPTHFNVVIPPIASKDLGITREQLVDLSIMSGCDFNKRIPNFGIAKAWKKMKVVLSNSSESVPKRIIEHIQTMDPNMPWESLNAERCREIFMDMSACEEAIKNINPKTDLRVIVENIKNDRVRYAAEKGLSVDGPKNTKFF